MRFKVNDIVRIAKGTRYYIDIYNRNPRDTNGIIQCINDYGGHNITVKWDNDNSACYEEIDLRLRMRNNEQN